MLGSMTRFTADSGRVQDISFILCIMIMILLLILWLQTGEISAAPFSAMLTGEQAVVVARQYTGEGKVLSSAQVINETGHVMYRIKILVPPGVLRTVIVDAETGAVVE